MELPITDPVGVFFILLSILLVAPMLADRLRIPRLVGVLLMGAVIGPHGFRLLAVNSFLEALGTLGLLYIFLEAGLDIDLEQLRGKKRVALVFGGLTFLLPLGLGYAAGVLLLGMKPLSAILLGSLFATHTLLPYPIVRTMGLAGSRAVFASIGATAITDTLAMLALALTTAGAGIGGWAFWLRAIGMLTVWTVLMVILLPAISSRFFRRIKAGGPSEFIFVLTITFFCSATAKAAGLEPVIGAFLAGLILNRYIPERGELLARVRFVGDALFIPICVLYIGMLSDVPSLFVDARTALVAPILLLVLLAAKYGASLILKPLFEFSMAEVNIAFGLSVNQAAPALATAVVGYRLGLFDSTVLNSVVVLFVATCVLGSAVTKRAAARLALEDSREGGRAPERSERILIAVSNPATLRNLTELAILARGNQSEEPVIPVCVVQESPNSDRDLEQAEAVLTQAIAQGVAAGVPVRPATLLCLNAAEGILRAAREHEASAVLIGWNRAPKPSAVFFGDVIDQLVANGHELTIVARPRKPLPEAPGVLLVIPPFVERYPGCSRAYALLRHILGGVPAKLTGLTLTADSTGVRESLRQVRGATPHILELETWKDFPGAIEKFPAATAFVFLSPRPGRPAWHPALEQLPRTASEAFPESTLLVFYLPDNEPEEAGALESGDPASDSSIPSPVYPTPAESPGPVERQAPQAYPSEPRGAASNLGSPASASPRDRFYQGLVRSGRVVPNLASAAIVDAIRDLLELGFPGDRKTLQRLTGVYSDIAQRNPIELQPGVLLLHAHVDNIDEPLVLIGAKPSGLRLLALEGPVRVIVLLCSPSAQSPEDHLRVLSLIAQTLRDQDRIERLLGARTKEELGLLDDSWRLPR